MDKLQEKMRCQFHFCNLMSVLHLAFVHFTFLGMAQTSDVYKRRVVGQKRKNRGQNMLNNVMCTVFSIESGFRVRPILGTLESFLMSFLIS